MGTTLYHLAFLAIDAALAYALVRRWRSHSVAWRETTKGRHVLAMLIALVLLVAASAVLAFMTWISIEGWRQAVDPARPRGLFEVFWVLGLVAYGTALGFAEPLHLLARGRAEEMLRLH